MAEVSDKSSTGDAVDGTGDGAGDVGDTTGDAGNTTGDSPGEAGDAGSTGEAGDAGSAGEAGDAGSAGDAGDAGSTDVAGTKNGAVEARGPRDPSILVSEAEASRNEMEALSELEEISAALVEPGTGPAATLAALTPSAASPSGASIKSGMKPPQSDVLAGVQALVGTVISGRYEVKEVLAAGGMGCVYRGEHVHMHKRVAIKVLLPNTDRLPELVQRFKREAVAGAHIDHPNIAAATDFGMLDDGSFFLILQFVRGVTLHDVIRRGPVPAQRAARMVRQVASALDACHHLGIIHRDLKPRNIMVEEDRDDFVKLIDFGFAKVPMDRIATVERKGSLKDLKVTAMGTIFGTPSYMAPEIALGMDAVDHRSDLYALGVIFYEMLAGAHPYDTKVASDLLIMHRTVVPPSIAERTGVEVPPAMEAIAMRLLQKDPTLRYPSAAALVEAIDEVMVGSQPPRTPQPTNPQISPQSTPPQASSQPSPQASSQPSPQVSSQPSPQASSQPGAPSSEPAASSAQAVAAVPSEPTPATAQPKSSENTPRSRERAAAPSPSRATLPRWALPASVLSLLAAIGVLVVALRGGGPVAPVPQGEVSAQPVPPAPTATAVVTAAPTAAATQSAAPDEPPPSDATLDPLRQSMRAAVNSKEWDRGVEALLELAERAPNAFEDRDVARLAMNIAAGVAGAGDERAEAEADKVFDVLTNKLGSTGLDILYSMVSSRGGSKAAGRATEILRDKKVLKRASPALRIAIELREAPSCKERLALLDRAKKDGDTRAVAVLDIWRAQRCIGGAGECCFRTNKAVDETMTAIWARVRTPAPQ